LKAGLPLPPAYERQRYFTFNDWSMVSSPLRVIHLGNHVYAIPHLFVL
jgi:hypothetical protein